MHVVVAYDICDDRRLQRVAKISEDYGTRVQKSVFELQVSSGKLREMISRIEREIDPTVDGVKYFILCGKCSQRGAEVIGNGVYVDPDSEYMVL